MTEEPMYVDECVSNKYERAQEESELERAIPKEMPRASGRYVMGRITPYDPEQPYGKTSGTLQQ